MSTKQPLLAAEIKLHMIADKTRRLLVRHGGVNALRSLSRSLNITDDYGYWSNQYPNDMEYKQERLESKGVTRSEFVNALCENNCALSSDEIDIIFAILDRYGKETIDPTDFMASLRGSVAPLRRTWIERVWNCFRKVINLDGYTKEVGSVSIAILRACYDASQHCDVLQRKRSITEVQEELNATFNNDTNPSGCVTMHEFIEYYVGVSVLMYDDNDFVSLLCGVWNKLLNINDNVTGGVQYEGNNHQSNINTYDNASTEIGRAAHTADGNIHSNSSTACNREVKSDTEKQHATSDKEKHPVYITTADNNKTGIKTLSAFNTLAENDQISVMRDHQVYLHNLITQTHRPQIIDSPLAVRELTLDLRRCDVDKRGFLPMTNFISVLREHRLYIDHVSCLDVLCTCHNSLIDYLYYIKLLLPSLSPAREMMLSRLWHTLFTRKDDYDRVCVRDIHRCYVEQSGEAKNEFLNAWDVRKALHGVVTFNEFIEWFIPQSIMVESDKDFECMLLRT